MEKSTDAAKSAAQGPGRRRTSTTDRNPILADEEMFVKTSVTIASFYLKLCALDADFLPATVVEAEDLVTPTSSHGGQQAKGKMRLSNFEGLAPVKEECFSESLKVKLPAFRASDRKIKYANTYRLEPYNKFQDQLVRDKAEAILMNKLEQVKYDADSSPSMCASISEEIVTATKEMGFDRYKYVVTVLIVEKADQAINVASRWVWDVKRDTWVSAKYETKTFLALALIMACYYE